VLENKSGVTLIGAGAPYKFAYVPDINTAPQGLSQLPAGLSSALDVESLNQWNPPKISTDTAVPTVSPPTTGVAPVDNATVPAAPSVPATPNLPNLPLPRIP